MREQKAIPRYQANPEEQKRNKLVQDKMEQMTIQNKANLRKISEYKNDIEKEREEKAELTELYVSKMQEMEAKQRAMEAKIRALQAEKD